jgi:hypothetical protein
MVVAKASFGITKGVKDFRHSTQTTPKLLFRAGFIEDAFIANLTQTL